MYALIIGGNSGLGMALAREAHTERVTPILTHRPSRGRVYDESDGSHHLTMDVTDPDSVDAAFASLERRLHDVDYVFYTPGMGLRGSLSDQSMGDITRVMGVSLMGMVWVFQALLRDKMEPCHVIAVTSTTSWKVRSNETIYGAAKAGQAQFARNFHQELVKARPGSRSLIVHPGGMRTAFWQGTAVDTSKFLEPDEVASLIWREVRRQEHGTELGLHEMHILRGSDGLPVIERGVKAPQY